MLKSTASILLIFKTIKMKRFSKINLLITGLFVLILMGIFTMKQNTGTSIEMYPEENIQLLGDYYRPYLIEYQARYGIPSNVSCAMIALQTNGGRSMTRGINNPLNVGCFEDRCENGHCKRYYETNQFYRIYENEGDCFYEFFDILAINNQDNDVIYDNKHYQEFIDNNETLLKVSYNMEPEYLIGIIKNSRYLKELDIY